MSDLSVYCVCVGTKYPDAYVLALRDAVAEHLTIPHTFKCITTRRIEGVKTVLPYVPYQGWWSKFSLFAPTIARGPSLYFDLDVAITGNIDYLAEYTEHEFAAPENWAKSGHGGIQSSVMAWRGGFHAPYEKIKSEWAQSKATSDGYRQFGNRKIWGDQEYITEMLGDNWVKIPGIGSYKYHIRPGQIIPGWMRVCVFHGEPKPIDVEDECVLPFTANLRRRIRENTRSGLNLASAVTV